MAHIQIDSIEPRISYDVGASPQTVFTIPFPFFDASDVRCSVGGVEMESGFAVIGAGQPSGGTLTLTTPVSNTVVTIWRDVAIKRTSQFPTSGPFRTDALNTDLNKQVAVSQQLADRMERSIRLPAAERTVPTELPPAAARAGKSLVFGADGGVTVSTFDYEQQEVFAAQSAAGAAAAATARAGAEGARDDAARIRDQAAAVALGDFVADATGAYPRPVIAKLRESVSVLDFIDPAEHAAIKAGTSTYDCHAALQAALGTGRPIYIPAGRYCYTAALTITHSGQLVYGDGAATLLAPAGGADDCIVLGDGEAELLNVTLRDLNIWPQAAKTAGAALRLRACSRLTLRNLRFGTIEQAVADGLRFADGLRVDGGGWGNLLLDNVSLIGGTGTGALFWSEVNNGSEVFFQGNCAIAGAWAVGLHLAGGCGGLDLAGLDIFGCVTGFLADDSLGDIANREVLAGSGFTIDSCTGVGLRLAANGLVHGNFAGSWIAGSTGTNVQIDVGQPGGAHHHFTGCHVQGGLSHGYDISSGTVVIAGGKVEWNGRGAAGGHGVVIRGTAGVVAVCGAAVARNGLSLDGVAHPTTGDGVRIEAGSRPVTVTGNPTTGNARAAVRVLAGCDNFRVGGNDPTGSGDGHVNLSGESPTRRFWDLPIALTTAAPAGAVNGVAVIGAAAGSDPYMQAYGPGSAVHLKLFSKGRSHIWLGTGADVDGPAQVLVLDTPGATHQLHLTGGAGTHPTVSSSSGGVAFGAIPILPSYTVATLPAGAGAGRGVVYVSDGAGNKRLAVSDGLNWRWPDGNIVT